MDNGYNENYWDKLPEFDLYMDQVVTFMERYLDPVKVTEDEKTITSSMINNYTKDGLVPRPSRKKYSRKHIASLAIVCMLKPVLPITDIKRLLSYFKSSDEEFKELYSVFCMAQERAFEVTVEMLTANDQQSDEQKTKKELCFKAIEMVALSNAYRIAAQKLLKQAAENNK